MSGGDTTYYIKGNNANTMTASVTYYDEHIPV
jgi:hypothetical protein